jgi:hypothetical protein
MRNSLIVEVGPFVAMTGCTAIVRWWEGQNSHFRENFARDAAESQYVYQKKLFALP